MQTGCDGEEKEEEEKRLDWSGAPVHSRPLNLKASLLLLDIDEVPIANKRKRKPLIEDVVPRPEGKIKHPRLPSKGEPDTPTPTTPMAPPSYAATPDYAAGLGSEYEPLPMSPAYGLKSPEFEGQGPSTSMREPMGIGLKKEPLSFAPPPPPVIPPLTPTFTPGIDKPAELPLFGHPPPTPATPNTPSLLTTPTTPAPPPAMPSAAPGDQSQQAPMAKKGLKLSRQQVAIAQEMFKESPSLTREQKALILGFMAGSRDNPNPSQQVHTIKLNSKQEVEEVALPTKDPAGGMVKGKRTVLIETVFEMNYGNGQWRKLQLKRTFPVAATPSGVS